MDRIRSLGFSNQHLRYILGQWKIRYSDLLCTSEVLTLWTVLLKDASVVYNDQVACQLICYICSWIPLPVIMVMLKACHLLLDSTLPVPKILPIVWIPVNNVYNLIQLQLFGIILLFLLLYPRYQGSRGLLLLLLLFWSVSFGSRGIE